MSEVKRYYSFRLVVLLYLSLTLDFELNRLLVSFANHSSIIYGVVLCVLQVKSKELAVFAIV